MVHFNLRFGFLMLTLLGVIQSCAHQTEPVTSRDAQDSPVEVTAAATEPLETVPNNDCWWFDLGKGSLVAVWVSPRLPGQVEGGFRFVNIVYHNPASERSFLLHSSPVPSLAGKTIKVANGPLVFTVAPQEGLNWDQVVTRKHLAMEWKDA